MRWIAGLGVALVLAVRLVQSFPFPPRWWIGLLLMVVLVSATALVAVFLMPRAVGTLAKNPDLLVPLGLLLVVLEVFVLLAKLPFLGAALSASHVLSLLNLSFTVSLHSLVGLVLAVIYAGWVTALVVQVARGERADLDAALPVAGRHFLRLAGVMLLGWAGVFGLLLVTGLAMRFLSWFALVLLLPALVGWNLATAAALPEAIWHEGGLLSAFGAGIRVGLANLRHWWMLLLAQMLMLGLLYFGYVSTRNGGSQSTSWNWSVNTFWIGGYTDNCQLYGKLTDTYSTRPVPFFAALLTLLFAALAIAIKIALVQRLYPHPPTVGLPPLPTEPPPISQIPESEPPVVPPRPPPLG